MSKTDWLTVADAAALCGVTPGRIRTICQNGWRGGKFRNKLKGKQIEIHPADVEKFRLAKRVAGNPSIAKHARAGGKKGGPARAEKLSAKKRSAISALGAKAKKKN